MWVQAVGIAFVVAHGFAAGAALLGVGTAMVVAALTFAPGLVVAVRMRETRCASGTAVRDGAIPARLPRSSAG